MTYVYKNLLIVERESSHFESVKMLKDYFNTWFPPRQLFEAESASDKIILYYDDTISTSDNIEPIKNIKYAFDKHYTGTIKILIDAYNIKIIFGDFSSPDTCKKALSMLKDYFIHALKVSSKSDNKLNELKCTVYWKPELVNINDQGKIIITNLGLLTNLYNLSHTFTSVNIIPENSPIGYKNFPINNEPTIITPQIVDANTSTSSSFIIPSTQNTSPTPIINTPSQHSDPQSNPFSFTPHIPSTTTQSNPFSFTATIPSTTTQSNPFSFTATVPSSATQTNPFSFTPTIPSTTTQSNPFSFTATVPSSATQTNPFSFTPTIPSTTTQSNPFSFTATVPSSATQTNPFSFTPTIPSTTTQSNPFSFTATVPSSAIQSNPFSSFNSPTLQPQSAPITSTSFQSRTNPSFNTSYTPSFNTPYNSSFSSPSFKTPQITNVFGQKSNAFTMFGSSVKDSQQENPFNNTSTIFGDNKNIFGYK
jgi:hypothetical protein